MSNVVRSAPDTGRSDAAAPHGPLILCGTAALVLLIATAIFSGAGIQAWTLRLFVRSTARLSFVLFLLVFTASALGTLRPSRATRWLLAHRRNLGFALALSHTSVALALITFARRYNTEYYTVTYGLQRIGGVFGYVALLVLVVSSFDTVKKRFTPAVWRATHTSCIWFLFINFLVSYARRTLLLHDPFFLPFFSLLAGAVLLRVLAARRRASAPGLASA